LNAKRRFASFDDFFAYYVRQHSDRRNRMLHLLGTTLGLLVLAAALALRRPLLALLWPVVSYGFAWLGHFAMEKNKPASFEHPWWSFLADFRMLALVVTRRLGPWLDGQAPTRGH